MPVAETLQLCWERRYRLDEIYDLIKPGGRLHPAFFFEAKGHLAAELLLLLIIVYLLTRKSFKPRKSKPLSKAEQEELIEDWQPEPLVPTTYATAERSVKGKQKLQIQYKRPPVVKGKASAPYVQIGSRKVMNLVSTNFLNLANSEAIETACEKALHKYGCGSCGPRGFYGTIDVHLELEERMAKFLGTEEAILYSYDISTPASTIPAFCKSGDLIVADAGVSYAVQSGLTLSRSTVKFFKHNDLEDLRRVLKSVTGEDEAAGANQLQRRFIVVEGVYVNYGDLAPLPQIVELKEKYSFRLICEESYALGVLGANGRGSAEHHGLDVDQIDITLASLGNAIGSVGGICAGSRRVCDHQRLSGAGYVFSASLPPYLASAAIESLNILEDQGPDLVAALAGKVKRFRALLASALDGHRTLRVHQSAAADARSPVVHLRLDDDTKSEVEGVALLQTLVDACMRDGVFLTLAKYTFLDKFEGSPSIRMAINVNHSDEDLAKAVATIKRVVEKARIN